MYYKDTAGHMEVMDIAGAAATNTGLVARQAFFSLSRQVDLIGCLHLDMAFQECLLPSDVGLRLKLTCSKDAFCLMAPAAANAFKLQITECILYE